MVHKLLVQEAESESESGVQFTERCWKVRTQSDLDRYVRTGLLYALDAFSEVSERIVLLEDALSASADANKQVLREGC
jgi:hypothetical protein